MLNKVVHTEFFPDLLAYIEIILEDVLSFLKEVGAECRTLGHGSSTVFAPRRQAEDNICQLSVPFINRVAHFSLFGKRMEW